MNSINKMFLLNPDGSRGELIEVAPVNNVKYETVRVENHQAQGNNIEIETHSIIKFSSDGASHQPENYQITRLAFLSRFTTEELVNIDLAGVGDTVISASVRTFMLKVNSASYIDLSRADTKEGVLNLVGLSLLTDVRAGDILNTHIEEVERPQ
jgi:hypothetical protein